MIMVYLFLFVFSFLRAEKSQKVVNLKECDLSARPKKSSAFLTNTIVEKEFIIKTFIESLEYNFSSQTLKALRDNLLDVQTLLAAHSMNANESFFKKMHFQFVQHELYNKYDDILKSRPEDLIHEITMLLSRLAHHATSDDTQNIRDQAKIKTCKKKIQEDLNALLTKSNFKSIISHTEWLMPCLTYIHEMSLRYSLLDKHFFKKMLKNIDSIINSPHYQFYRHYYPPVSDSLTRARSLLSELAQGDN